MSTTTHQPKFTYQDYLLFPDDGKRYELIAGDKYVTPAPRTRHQKISSNLQGILFDFVKKHNIGIVLSAPTDVVFSEMDVVQPDLLLVSRGRESIITENNIQGAPDLVVEILSESTRRTDEHIKRKLYEQHGVREYWIIDPDVDTCKIYRMVNNTYKPAIVLTLEAQDRVTTPMLPGWELPLQELFP